MHNERSYLNLYFVAGSQDCRHLPGDPPAQLLNRLEQALQGGISCYQFREKGAGALQEPAAIRSLARQCRDLCRRYSVPFFVNNEVELALDLGADGIHVGQEDMPVREVIARCGGKMKIGLTVNTLQQAQANAAVQGIDYFGVGPIFATQSKADAKHTVGAALLHAIRAAGIAMPLVAIGGITPQNCTGLRRAGADGLAVISALTRSTDLTRDIQHLSHQL